MWLQFKQNKRPMGIRFYTASIRLNLLELPHKVGFSEHQNGIIS